MRAPELSCTQDTEAQPLSLRSESGSVNLILYQLSLFPSPYPSEVGLDVVSLLLCLTIGLSLWNQLSDACTTLEWGNLQQLESRYYVVVYHEARCTYEFEYLRTRGLVEPDVRDSPSTSIYPEDHN